MTGIDPLCPVCNGTGGYSYDHNHGTICPLCCPHERFYLQSEHHIHPGEITCGGCGWEARNEPWTTFDPDAIDVEAEYKILYRFSRSRSAIGDIVHTADVHFGRKVSHGRVAISRDREINPSDILAVMRIL